MKRMASTHHSWSGLALALVAILAFTASAQAAPRTTKHGKSVATRRTARRIAPVAVKTATPAPGEAGMRIYRDPETGAIGAPSAQQLQADGLISPINESQEGLVERRLPNGTVMIDLQGRFQDYAIVRRGAKGNLVFDCARTSKELKAVSNAPAKAEDR